MRAEARMGESGDLLYEQALVFMDQGRVEDVAAAAERLAALGATARSRSLTLLVKMARQGMSSVFGETTQEVGSSDEHAILELLDAGLWIELQQRGPSSFAAQLMALRERPFKEGQQEVLSDALLAVLRRLVRSRSALSRSPEWPDTLAMMSSRLPEFALPLQLFSVGVRYAATQDKGILLELPLEVRKLLTDAWGMAS